MPFCYSPWTNIDISPMGDISPCCKFQTQQYSQQFNIQKHTVKEYNNSDFLKQIKQEFQTGEWPKGCDRCRIEEENAIESKRILDYTRWKDNYQQYNLNNQQFITASLAFGNTCNLKCITCSSYASSQWRKEYQDIYNIDIRHFKFYKQNFVKDFVETAPNIIHFDIPGGEPFLSGICEQKELLQYYINSNSAKNISLHYTTNATIFPDDNWWELWKHFKEIDMQLSIDGIDTQYEYIRFPAKWNDLITNVIKYVKKEKQLSNLRLSVSHTVSAYNIFYLDDFFQWCYNIGLPHPWLGRVHNPAHMRPTIWTNRARTKIVTQLLNSKHKDLLTWATLIANNNDSALFETFKTKVKEHDAYRQLDFGKTFPELAEYL